MPERIQTSTLEPEKGSIIKLLPGEELFLSYSNLLTNGPPIQRTGLDSPFMEVIDQIGKITTDPDEQRWLSWFLDETCKKTAKMKWKSRSDGTPHWTKEEWMHHVHILTDHLSEFTKTYRDYKIVGQQGCGDLTMNEWNVAYVKSKQTSFGEVLIVLPQEPLFQRNYTCLVKRKDTVIIENNVNFTRYPKPKITINNKEENEIEFAVSGRQVIRNGQVNNFLDISEQFSDLRHLVQLPNLNPERGLLFDNADDNAGKKIQTAYHTRPRVFFGEEKKDDVWLGEAQLLTDRNLRRAALTMPIYLNLHYEGLGVPKEVVRNVMLQENYKEVDVVRDRGEWRFLPKDYRKPGEWIEVFLKTNKYPCSMIGVSEDGKSVYLLAYAGGYWNSPTGKTIEEVANDFIKFTNEDVYNALLFDEGGDVFQKADLNDGKGLQTLVNTSRLQLRCCFIAGKKIVSEGKEEFPTNRSNG